jgi:hypothetical protein
LFALKNYFDEKKLLSLKNLLALIIAFIGKNICIEKLLSLKKSLH